MPTPFVISVISLCLCICCFFFCRWYIARKTAARELLADYRAEVYRLIAEIDTATDRDSLLVEERIKTLRKLIEDTDRRISVYIKELQRSRTGEAMYTSLGRGIRAALDSRPPSLEAPTPVETQLPEMPVTSSETAVPAPAAKKRISRKRQTQVPPQNEDLFMQQIPLPKEEAAKPKLKVQIAEMSAQGLSPPEIASRLHLSLAEVELALNLLHRPVKGE